MESHDIVVLGAGLTGLSFAYHYDGAIPVFEKNLKAGGLVSTTRTNGRKFDQAPHLLHVRSDYVKDLLFNRLEIRLERHIRRAKIYFDNRLFDYPFELNLFALSEKIKKDCLNGLNNIVNLERTDEDKLRSGSYKDYAIKAFGSGIANHYLLPYNQKVWDTDPNLLTCEWMKFLPTARVEEIIKCSEQPCTSDKFGYNAEFFYPSDEGIQELSDAFAKELSSLYLNQEVQKINLKNKIIHFKDGKEVRYEKVISTIPLKNLINISTLDGYKEVANRLSNTCVYNINIVVKGNLSKDIHWIYFPESGYRFYRISFPKNFFRGCAPGNEEIISVEIASKDQNLDIEKLKNRIIEDILNVKFLNINDILFTHSIRIPIAYCVYDKERTKIVKLLIKKLHEKNIISVGRYGCWEYSCMEDAILTGRNLAFIMKGQ